MHQVRQASADDVETIARFNQAMALETENLRLSLPTLVAGARNVVDDRSRGQYFVVDGPDSLAGSLLIAMQAICIVVAVGVFGDAARVNVVYALRGLWGVALAWLAARKWGGAEAEHSRETMLFRVAGATVLTTAVILAIVAG